MPEVIIIGHKNPDSDSVCSAYAYANLKNIIDNNKRYTSARCGNLNKQTRFIFDKAGLTPPKFLSDIYPKVKDVMTHKVVAIDENEPIKGVIKNIEELKIRITPVISGGTQLEGVISILELAHYFTPKDEDGRPVYLFRGSNFEKSIKGYTHIRGQYDEFEASVFIGAMPFERFKEQMEKFDFKKSILVVGKRRDIIEYAIDNELPAIVLTGIRDEADIDIDFSDYKGWVYISDLDTAETVRNLQLSIPAKSFMTRDVPQLKEGDYLDAAGDILMSVDHKGLPVTDEGRLIGILTRSDIIKKVQRELILMDHNEMSQAVDGAETAKITEIVDHHRLGTIKTKTPVHFYAKPVGSTCTLVYQLYKINGHEPDKDTATILLSGILSDTVILKSPTTTDQDIDAVKELEEISGLNFEKHGVEMFSATDSLKARNVRDIINADFKAFSEYGKQFGIGQVEVVNIEELDGVKDNLLEGLSVIKNEKGLTWSMLLVTDIIKEESVLLTSGYEPAEKLLSYKQSGERHFYLPGVLSRKKQLLPEILRVLEDLTD
ncbi:Inorganic diphosphatase [Denitrovibrio acetiphilus DSM 12809]|uniref:inorganic diphosphatase n=1 Tax=Denitrovibrio acetiphilus (strain DSM 12809 / NBRC 114555 / N2460) TaxID=522772 RepID=D4H1N4_DENA2|nr:putative manganese-dependent inorganic diphosphatase [Denitrovibrio acetiphilus]ADD68794.1 Inorganic diphosphatase [Denitrovibrio acetiphilus DSM 12809]